MASSIRIDSVMENVDLAQVGGDHLIKLWEPGNQVVFYRPTRISIILALLFLLIGFGCFLLLVSLLDAREEKIGPLTILFLLGSVLGGYGFYGFVECWPRTVIFDWEQHGVIWVTLFGKKVTSCAKISELVLQVKMYGGKGLLFHGPRLYSLSMQIVENSGTHTSFSQVCESDPHFELERGIEHCLPVLQCLASTLSLPGRVLHWDGTVIHSI